MPNDKFISTIIEKIQLAQNEQIVNEKFYSTKESPNGKNEFLFFIKPEITQASDSINLKEVISLVLNKLSAYKLSIKSASILSANYLQNFNIIARHYGVINRLSNDIHSALTDAGKEKFEAIYGKKFKDVEIYGSIEFLKEFNEFTPLTLDYLWQQKEFTKIAGGTYCQELDFNGRIVYLIDGFHPRQLEHFTKPGRSIVTFTLVGDIPWGEARNHFIGATNPEAAEEGSTRREFFLKQESLGLPPISASWNGVHLSAGPVEGLVELIRYNSDLAYNNKQSAADYNFGKNLITHFGEDATRKILKNCDILIDGKRESVFDATEEKDSDEAIELLKTAEIL